MAKRVSPAVIGAFVVGSFAVLVTALVVVGAGQLFAKPRMFVCMFQGDLNGLKVGAPVKFRGVQIGSVAEIRLFLSPADGRLRPGVHRMTRLPVIIAIEPSLITSRGGSGAALKQSGFEDVLKSGLRAQLNVESLLTGLLYIDLDLHPNAPMDLVLEPGGPYREIPTVPTTLEAVQKEVTDALKRFKDIDFKALAASITDAADSIKGLTGSPALKATLDSLKEATANLNTTLISVRAAINNVNDHVDPLAASLEKNSAEVNATLVQTRATLADLQATLDPESPLAVHLNETLDQLTETTRSIGFLTDYLQRNPSSIVRGKYVPEKDR
jgi:paraquat-inducible protein B